MERAAALLEVERCDRELARTAQLLAGVQSSTGREQQMFAQILRARIDTQLDLRNYYAPRDGDPLVL